MPVILPKVVAVVTLVLVIVRGAVPLVLAAAVCFVIRMLGVRYNLNAPRVRTRSATKPAPPPD